MRTVLSVLTAVPPILNSSNVRADEEAAAIIRRAIKAHGGEQNIAKLMTCQIQSEGTVQPFPDGHPGKIVHTFKTEFTTKPGKFKVVTRVFETSSAGGLNVTLPLASVRSAFNGEEGQLLIDGKSQLLKDEALKEFKALAHDRQVCLLTPLLADKDYELTVLDEKAKVSGNAAIAVMVRRKGNKDITLYFDKETAGLVKAKRDFYHIGNKKEGELLTFFKDFRNVEGAIVPHRLVVYHDGKEYSQERIIRISVLRNAPDSWF